MPRDFKRSDRVADALQRSLARIIQHELGDPRLGMVNINSVSVAKDLTSAKIYVTFVAVESEEECEDAVTVLNNASSFMRNLVSKELTTRITPKLYFYFDKVAVQGQALSSLIDRVVAADRSRQVTENSDDSAELSDNDEN